ncbi:MAG TPA: hypothetical protein VF228_15750 [Iamia sp.]
MVVTGRSKRGRAVALVVAAVALATLGVAAAPAAPGAAAPGDCTKSWTTPTSGDWSDASRWSGGTVPQASDSVCITVPGTYTVSLEASATVAFLQVGAAPTARGATLEVGDGGTTPLTLASLVTVEGTLRALQPLTVSGPLTIDGTVDMADGITVTQALWTKHGTLEGCGQLHADDVRIGDLDFDFESGHPSGGDCTGDGDDLKNGVAVDGGIVLFDGDGEINVWATGIVNVSGAVSPRTILVLESNAVAPSALRFGGIFVNHGRVAVWNGRGQPADMVDNGVAATFINYGELDISPLVDPSGHVPSTTTIDTDVINVGEIDTRDPWTAAQDLVNEGELYLRVPGLEVEGDLRQRAAGILHHVASDEDVTAPVTVAGTATLDGTLRSEANLEDVAIGDHFPVLRAGARTGRFRHHEMGGVHSYDIAYDGADVDIVRRASETPLHDLVRAVYDDLLGRPPTSSELSSAVADIQAGRLSQGSLLRRLARSTEHLEFVVDEIFIDGLGVHADPAGQAFWVDQLRTRRRTVAQVTAAVHGSPAAYALVGGIDASWLQQRFITMLGRSVPTEAEHAYWLDRLASVGRTRIALELFATLEARRYRVGLLYEDLLRRPAAPSETAYWAPRLAVEGDLVLVAFVAASPEYAVRADLRYP